MALIPPPPPLSGWATKKKTFFCGINRFLVGKVLVGKIRDIISSLRWRLLMALVLVVSQLERVETISSNSGCSALRVLHISGQCRKA